MPQPVEIKIAPVGGQEDSRTMDAGLLLYNDLRPWQAPTVPDDFCKRWLVPEAGDYNLTTAHMGDLLIGAMLWEVQTADKMRPQELDTFGKNPFIKCLGIVVRGQWRRDYEGSSPRIGQQLVEKTIDFGENEGFGAFYVDDPVDKATPFWVAMDCQPLPYRTDTPDLYRYF